MTTILKISTSALMVKISRFMCRNWQRKWKMDSVSNIVPHLLVKDTIALCSWSTSEKRPSIIGERKLSLMETLNWSTFASSQEIVIRIGDQFHWWNILKRKIISLAKATHFGIMVYGTRYGTKFDVRVTFEVRVLHPKRLKNTRSTVTIF